MAAKSEKKMTLNVVSIFQNYDHEKNIQSTDRKTAFDS